jgi:hypothetical protein
MSVLAVIDQGVRAFRTREKVADGSDRVDSPTATTLANAASMSGFDSAFLTFGLVVILASVDGFSAR